VAGRRREMGFQPKVSHDGTKWVVDLDPIVLDDANPSLDHWDLSGVCSYLQLQAKTLCDARIVFKTGAPKGPLQNVPLFDGVQTLNGSLRDDMKPGTYIYDVAITICGVNETLLKLADPQIDNAAKPIMIGGPDDDPGRES